MAQQTINVGAAPNDGTGDPDRTAWTKANANFTELYGHSTTSPPQGRLTLATTTPVMTTTQSAKTTIFYTPYAGNNVPIYDGTNMVMTAFTELNVTTADTTKSPAAIGASKVNDWFVWNDVGTIRLGHGPDWTNDTTRSAGTALTMVNGILLNNAAITNGPAAQRGTYVGTTYSNASSQLDWIYGGISALGTAGFFWVWNCYNRINIATMVGDSTDSWTYNATTIRAANASNTMRVSLVRGLDEEVISAEYRGVLLGGANSLAGIGLDSTSAFAGLRSPGYQPSGLTSVNGYYVGLPGIGMHFVQACEAVMTATVVTFYGDNTNPLYTQSGMAVQLRA